MHKPKILLLDIETAPILAYVWGLWDNNVALNMVKKDWHILSWSAKWLDDPASKVMYQDQRKAKDIENDKEMLKGIWKLLDEADIIVTQNGKKFDQKKLFARFLIHGFQPPSDFRHVDTCQLAKRHFGFTSNKLEYLTDKLGTKYKKLKHKKFPGFELWKECLAGNPAAWKEMEKYNKYDVLSLEEVYLKLRPWDNSINPNVYAIDGENACDCGSREFHKNGIRASNSGKYQRYTCNDCGKSFRGQENMLAKDRRKSMFKP